MRYSLPLAQQVRDGATYFDDALKMVKDTSMAFFFVAGLQAALSFILGFEILFDAVVYAVGGFFLRHSNSRTAAIIRSRRASSSSIHI